MSTLWRVVGYLVRFTKKYQPPEANDNRGTNYEPQEPPFCMGGQATEPYEQYTQQSPFLGLSKMPHPLQS
jgi:hypothetical protein